LLSQVELSCGFAEQALVMDIGLARAEDGRIFVVSPETNELRVIATDPDTGHLDPNSVDVSIALGWRPRDVMVARGPIDQGTGQRPEMAVVAGMDETLNNGKVRVLRDVEEGLTDSYEPDFTSSGDFVSVAVRENGDTALLADQGQFEIRVLNLATEQVSQLKVSVLDTLRRLEAQRETP
jgi:hypothetical protein